MLFELLLSAPDGSHETVLYDTSASALIRDGKKVVFKNAGKEKKLRIPRATPVHPESPGKKHGPFRRIKIQMGLACNMGCSYCLQTPHEDEEKTSSSDVQGFIESFGRWCKTDDATPLAIEFWGGEPFLHWGKLKLLVPPLRELYPGASFSIITNGTLLDDEKVDFILRHKIDISVSHDGPGQGLRGKDPLKEPKPLAAIKRLLRETPENVSFNCVLTLQNHSLVAIREHLMYALDADRIALSTEGLIHVESAGSALLSPISDDDHRKVREKIASEIASGEALTVFTVSKKLSEFFVSLATGRKLETFGQKCGMDREDFLAVDLKGNVITCQNSPDLKIGNTSDMDSVSLDTSIHFKFRPDCLSCPVVQLCQGGCMYLEGRAWELSCKNNFSFNWALLDGALFRLTGKRLISCQRAALASKRKAL